MGTVSLRNLVAAEAGQPLSDLITRDIEVVRVDEPADAAAWRVVENQPAALPVVDGVGNIVGVLRVDAAVAQVVPPAWRAQLPRLFARTGALVVRLNIRGRSVVLYGLRRPLPGSIGWALILGPGIIAACAGNDAGGIATYSQVGARFGYDLLWLRVPITAALMVIQESYAQIGAATGRGLLDLVREAFGLGWSLFAVGVVATANAGLVVSEFLGILRRPPTFWASAPTWRCP